MSEEIKRIIWRREYRDAPYETAYLFPNGTQFKFALPDRYATIEDALAQENTIPPFEYYDAMRSFDPII